MTSDQGLWGILLIVYLVPFWLWQASEHSTIEARKKLYPGRADEEQRDSLFDRRSGMWAVGLCALLAAWAAEWKPVAAAVVLVAVAVPAMLAPRLVRRWNLLARRSFRLWLAGSGIWVLSVAAWYLVLGRSSDLRAHEVVFMGLLPPCIGALSVCAWHWAKKASA